VTAAPSTPEPAALKFPLVPAAHEGRAWFLPRAVVYWKTQDKLAAREAAQEEPGPIARG
jgi:hypothetical protein